jgi:hypothetical protein
MNNNFWGEPDDIEPLPDWMNPKTYSQPQFRKTNKSITDIINETMKKPPIPQIPDEPTNPTE